ncbi:glycosyltransferase family 2 protein [Flavobacterium johnsoniae]|uniref:Glycosyl transferase family 2 n=1 Tax=Flavobacterium johnsoniae TaxID=986 RepID=A0A1M5L3N9_FLAJO|nr:glycosyltransferase family 2 protein [Flavobacterium johnsoniae]SHG59033.1 Glycosyl transferase family 2 [Flavobacterium johnsoniae]
MQITIIYTFRNRDLVRIKKSLDSLVNQTLKNFTVFFVDYGSDENISLETKKLLSNYDFASYTYLYTNHQPWNKCKALNYVIEQIKSDYCFIADADMMFHSKFTLELEKLMNPYKIVYFQVGFLSKEESLKNISFEEYKIKFLTNKEATGMTLFPVEKLKEVNGFDEFFHFWGAEDTDIHNRLKNAGCEVEYYDRELLLLHQWHKNFRSREVKGLGKELQLSGIVEINHQHLIYNLENKVTIVKDQNKELSINEKLFSELNTCKPRVLFNAKESIDHFLYYELPNSKNEIISVEIRKYKNKEFDIKDKIKKILGKKVPKFYTLREINDLLLLHIISFYHYFPYSYTIGENLESIIFKIKK